MKNKTKIIGILIGIIIGVIIILLTKAMIPKTKPKEITCDKNCYEIISYSSSYNRLEDEKYYLLKSKKDYEEKVQRFLTNTEKDDFDFDKYDYLVYFVEAQHGCDRSKRINCVKFGNKEITLKIDNYEVNQTCDAIFFDAYIINLEKDKYNKDVVVNEEN